jgi:hypothetical protein
MTMPMGINMQKWAERLGQDFKNKGCLQDIFA